jgi:hypothetical protein
MVLPAAAVVPAGAWPRPDHGAWWYGHRPGRSDQKTRAGAWNCGACGTPSVVRGSHARQTSTTTGSLCRTAHTATGGLLARGAAAKIAACGARLSAGALFPVLIASGGRRAAVRCRSAQQPGCHGWPPGPRPAARSAAPRDRGQLDHWLQVAAPIPGFTGFAVGRSIWWDPLHAHLHHRSNAAWTRRRITTAYLDFVRYFLDARDGTLPVRYEPED